MDIIELLKKDHKEAQELLEKICATTEQAVKTREMLFPKLMNAMIVHSKAEEKAVYQSLEGKEEVHDIILESFEEHKLVETLLKSLAEMDVGDEAWTAKFAVLKENIEHHIEEEEGEFLPKVKKLLSKEQLQAMGEEFEELKEEVMEDEGDSDHRPHSTEVTSQL